MIRRQLRSLFQFFLRYLIIKKKIEMHFFTSVVRILPLTVIQTYTTNMMTISALVSALPDAPNAMVLAFIGLKKSPSKFHTNGWRVTSPAVPEEWHSTTESWVDYSARMDRVRQIERWDMAYDVLKTGWTHVRDIHIATILKNFETKKLGEVKEIVNKLIGNPSFKSSYGKPFKLNSMANFMLDLVRNLNGYGYDRRHVLLMLIASQKPSPAKTPKAKTTKAKTSKAPESDCFALVRQNSVCAVRALAVAEDDEDAPIGLLMKKK